MTILHNIKKHLVFSFIVLIFNTVSQAQNASPNIIGGQQIPISQAPWQVSVRGTLSTSGTHPFYGGGSIITPTWILTAAHVAVTLTPGKGYIRAATNLNYNNDDNSGGGQLIKVAEIVIHPGWNNNTLQNDIALLRLEYPISFNRDAQPIQYSNSYNSPNTLTNPGTMSTFTGWGTLCNGCNSATYLNYVEMPIISNQDANQLNLTAQYYNPNYIVTSDMIAAFQRNKSGSPGDSGGPMTVLNNNTPIQVGIMSWGYDPKGQYPTINTKVQSYQQWIKNTINAPLSSSLSSEVIPQLDDVYRVRWDAIAWGGDGGYTYSWQVDYNNGAGFVPVTNTGNILQITTSNPNICAKVVVTSNGQTSQGLSCASGGGASSFQAYPNPADSYIIVWDETEEDDAIEEVELRDQQGSIKFKGTIQNKKTKINTNNLKNDTYYLTIKKNKNLIHKRIKIVH